MNDNSSTCAAEGERPNTTNSAGVLGRVFSFRIFLLFAVSAGGLLVTVWEYAPVIAGRVFVEGDTWWHTAVGSAILRDHVWPRADTYSFTVPGAPWIAYEWLGEVAMAIVAKIGGVAGLSVLLALLAIAIALLTYYYAWLRCGNITAAAIATVAALQISPSSFTMRPQLMGYVLLLIILVSLERFRLRRTKALWFLPGIFLLWANTHSSFVLGFVALAAYGVGGLVEFRWGSLAADRWTASERKHLLGVTLLGLAAIFVTPYGARLAEYPLEVMLRQRVTLLLATEWLPLNFGPLYAKVLLVLVVGALLLHLAAPAPIRLDVLLLFLFTLIESCLHVRFLLFFVVIFSPMLASLLDRWLMSARAARGRPLLNALMIILLVGATVAMAPSRARLEHLRARIYPVGAVEYLRSHPVPERMFNDDNWGSYLICACPERKVFIDGRFDIYEYSGVLIDYFNLYNLREDPRPILEKYRVDAALLRTGSALQDYFAKLQGWTAVYQDSTSVIYVRSGAQP